MKQGHRGVTFVEMILVASLFALVATAIYGAFRQGLAVWDRSQQLVIEEDLNIFVERLGQELRNVYYHSQLAFVGYPKQLIIPTIITTPADPNSIHAPEGAIEQMGLVEYIFDWDAKTIRRVQYNYSQALNNMVLKGRSIVSQVRDLEFHYLFLTPDGLETQTYSEGVIPAAIELKIDYQNKMGSQTFEYTLNIPMGV